MPRWVLECPQCGIAFPHSDVAVPQHETMYDPYPLAPKPRFPDGGANLECPHCKVVSLYQGHQFTYESKRSSLI